MSARDRFVPAGSGGGGGGKSSGVSEAPDSLISTQYAEIVDLLGDGPWYGFAHDDPELDTYLDDTPIKNSDGSYNFVIDGNATGSSVPIQAVMGEAVQSMPGGFRPPASEQTVGVEVRADRPVVREVTDTRITALRITINMPQAQSQSSDGTSIEGVSVMLAVDLASAGGAYYEIGRDTITGKTTSGYARSYKIPLSGSGPWRVRVRRITPDSATTLVSDKIYWASYARLLEQQFSYPYSVVVQSRFRADQFSNVPTRRFDVKMSLVQVPQNYDPATRTYATTGAGTSGGVWDGSFKMAWTDNPAWCWYDIVTSKRKGTGRYIDVSMIDKFELYAIAQYCDELVPDGFGGQEPRFTCNLYLRDRQEAFKFISNLAGAFRSMSLWATGSILLSQDKPQSPVHLFTRANVEDGKFEYTGTARNARHTVALVKWKNPDNLFKDEVEYVELTEAKARYGYIETAIDALGCTSRGQAHRFGLHTLHSEWYCSEVVTFATGLECWDLRPGMVIATEDPARANERRGGRLLAATTTSVQLDAPVTLHAGRSYTLTVTMQDQTLEARAVNWAGSSDLTTDSLTLAAALPAVPDAMAIWGLASDDVPHEQWRILAIARDGAKSTITAVSYHPEIFALIDAGKAFTSPRVNTDRTRPGAVTALQAGTSLVPINATTYGVRVSVSWKAGANTTRYSVRYCIPGGNWQTLETTVPSFDVDNVPNGTFQVEVTPLNAIGRAGPIGSLSYAVVNNADAGAVTGLGIEGGGATFAAGDVTFVWDAFPGATYYEVTISDGATQLATASPTSPRFTFSAPANYASTGSWHRALTIAVRAVTPAARSQTAAGFTATNPAPAAPSLSVEAGVGSAGVKVVPPYDADVRGMEVFFSTATIPDSPTVTADYAGAGLSFTKHSISAGTQYYVRVRLYDDMGAGPLSSAVTVTPTFPGGVPDVADASALTAAAGSPPPGGDAYLVVFDNATGKMARWDTASGSYTFAVSSTDIAGQIEQAQLSAAFLTRVTDIETLANDDHTRVDLLSQSVVGGGNLLPNAGFEVDAAGWVSDYNTTGQTINIARDIAGPDWVPPGTHTIGWQLPDNTNGVAVALLGDYIPVEGGQRVCLSGYVAAHRSSALMELHVYDQSLAEIGPYYSTPNNAGAVGGKLLSNWARVHVFVDLPANAAAVRVKLRQDCTGDPTGPYVFLDLPMFEVGTGAQTDPSPWSPSAVGTRALVASLAQTVSDGDAANATAINQVSARLNDGGDIEQAIVTAQSTATTTANKVSGKYAITIDANGHLTGWELMDDGSTGTLVIGADKVVFSASSLIADAALQSPAWWGMGSAFPSFLQQIDGDGSYQPLRFFRAYASGGIQTFFGQKIQVNQGGQYRVRLRTYMSLDFAGNVFAGINFPSVTWACPAPTTTDAWNGGFAYYSPAEVSTGTWHTFDGTYTCAVTDWIQTRLDFDITAGFIEIQLEVVRASGTDLIIDGAITASKIDAAYTNTTVLQATQAVIDDLAANTVSARFARLGDITGGSFTLDAGADGTGAARIRTLNKAWGDNADGYILAGNHNNGSFYEEFRATSGSSQIIEQRGNGSDVGGWKYLTKIVDASGVTRFQIDPATGTYIMRGQVIAESGSFAGTLSGASGTFGTITAGYLQNADNSASLNLNASGTTALLRAGGNTLIEAGGATHFNNVFWSQVVTVNVYPCYQEQVGTSGSDPIYAPRNGVWVDFDLGMAIDVSQFYESAYSVHCSGQWSGTWPSGYTNWRLSVSGEIANVMPEPGASWTGCRLRARVWIYLTDTSNAVINPDLQTSAYNVQINTIGIAVSRLS